ncbi:uncharacterized protein FFC1_05948 [Fusarium fujikuroi]|nr:uncharacterized protein FFC1_05948 [Fusarium fujikuroi]
MLPNCYKSNYSKRFLGFLIKKFSLRTGKV